MMKKNWARSSFPMPLNTGSFIEFTILNNESVGGVGDGVSGGGEDGGGVDGCDEIRGDVGSCRETYD